MMHIFPRLDIMIAYSCNLSCKGCISLSDIQREGIAQYTDIKLWLANWKEIINPEIITLFGGEPCLHPKLTEIIADVRTTWPNCIIRIITNGYLLDNFDISSWFNYVPLEIQVSVHRKDHESIINDKIKNILRHKKNWKVKIFGGNHNHKQIEWSLDNFSIYKSIFKDFIVPYNKNITPWNSDPSHSHKICGSPASPILYKGKLYKCPPVANIIDITGKIYKDYNGIDVNDLARIAELVDNIGKPESVCSFCPDLSQATLIDHTNIKNVIVKQKILD